MKVASYCRVSTDSKDQANSFESQKRYFREYIAAHPEWELYEVYADEGITGTSTKKRADFNRMIHDAYQGKFQLILTKEVSRFSRNLLDTIAYTRELKMLGVGVMFMNDGFCSLDPDSELRLSIMGSIAQEESRKISSRVKWGQTRQMERGVVFGPSLLGYDVRNGEITINPEGSEIVRFIFHKYGIEKKGTSTIAKELRQRGYETLHHNQNWSASQIVKILRNEKYVGDLVQKKSITPDYLTHEKKRNRGQEQRVVIREHHDPIISRDLWDRVQEELKKRNRHNGCSAPHSRRYIFSGKILCGECGARFVARRKVRKNGTSYMRWICYTATTQGVHTTDVQGNLIGCQIGKTIRDELAAQILMDVIRRIPVEHQWIIQNLTHILKSVISVKTGASNQIRKLENEIRNIGKKKAKAIDAYLSGVISEEELHVMKVQYDNRIGSLQDQMKYHHSACAAVQTPDFSDMIRTLSAIISGREVHETFHRALLDQMIIQKGGTVEVRIHQLPQTWYFRLLY